MMVICLAKELFVVFVDCNCLAYCNQHDHDVAMVIMLNYFVMMFSLIFCLLLISLHKKDEPLFYQKSCGYLLVKGAVCCFC